MRCTACSLGLTRKRQKTLEAFDKKLAGAGCMRGDLEKKLEVKLVTVDALGNTLWDSGKYATKTRITMPCHNNHAWEEMPTKQPPIKSVQGLNSLAEDKLNGLYEQEPMTTASWKAREAKICETLIGFIARAISRSTRVWLCGHVIVTHKGEFYCSRRDRIAIDGTFMNEIRLDPKDLGYLPEDDLADFLAWSTRHSAQWQWLTRENICLTIPPSPFPSTGMYGKQHRLSRKSGTAARTLASSSTTILICEQPTLAVKIVSSGEHQTPWMWSAITVSLQTSIVERKSRAYH